MRTIDQGAGEARFDRATWRRFLRAVGNFAACEVRGQAAALAAALVVLLLGISGLNVVNSYVGRDFMTAIEHRDRTGFVWEAMLYVAVFAASTAAAVLYRFAEERLGLLWRGWLTKQIVIRYLSDRTYHRLLDGRLTNPDQRITEDVRTFVTTTLSLALMWLNGTITIVAFSGVLWSISRTLFLVGIAYAAVGSLVTVLIGRTLVQLNYRQADREADFRAALIDVRENADALALVQGERAAERGLLDLLGTLVANMRRIIAVNRNVGFFTTGYNYLIQIIPALVVAPLFIRGDAEFGVITQSAMAFSFLLGAFSLVVTQFQAISAYAAVLARLSALVEVVESPPRRAGGIDVVEHGNRVAYERLTLRERHGGRMLVDELSVAIPSGTRVLVRSGDPAARAALLHATAGLWEDGNGRIVRPPLRDVAFVPERPYLPAGALQYLLTTESAAGAVSDSDRVDVLRVLGIEHLAVRARTSPAEREASELLSVREQQLVAIARVLVMRPRFAFLEQLGETLEADRVTTILREFSARGITYVMLGEDGPSPDLHDAVLDVHDGGLWSWTPVRRERAEA